jgi:cell division septation protein DedD
MSDSRSAYDDGQLPWLEAVDDEDGPRGVSPKKMLAALLVVLVAAAIVAGTFFYLGRKDPVGIGAPQLIRAEPGPYKVKPTDPGGLDVAGESETAFETSAGEDSDAQLDLNALPEEAVARPKPPPKEVPKRIPPNETKEPVVVPPAPKPAPAPPSGPAGSVIQLGAYKNAAQAERAWTALSTRFPTVKAMTKLVVPFSGGFRLRAGAASPAEAKQACQALKVAGESCFVAN